MVEYYQRFYKKQYRAKVKQLIVDLKRLLTLEVIPCIKDDEIVLNTTFKQNLKDNEWLELNKMYATLFKNKDLLSPTLLKFINKNSDTTKANKFRLIDTFAGCGGLSLGLKRVGFQPVLINEIEAKFLESYYFNHDISIENYYCDDIKNLIDDEDIHKKYFKNIDLVVGGPPCQGFSMANRQRIIDDPRNELYRYFLRTLKLVHPKFFVMENVKGMMNKADEIKENFKAILGSDYTFGITLLNAKDFGIPQNRERVFFIGSRMEIDAQKIIEDILREKKTAKKFKLKDAIANLPALQPKRIKNTKGLENDEIGYKFRKVKMRPNSYSKFVNEGANYEYCFNHTNRYNNDRDIEIFARLPQGANSLHPSIADIMPYKSRNHVFKDKYFKLNENEVSKTITSHMKFDCNMYIHPNQPRGLSPREAARIQSFPDDFLFMSSNNNWYAQIGNAVPVKLAQIIGKHIIKHLS
ncbi:MAG: DNA cytosine methyltransferase [Bacteroidota bacterium]